MGCTTGLYIDYIEPFVVLIMCMVIGWLLAGLDFCYHILYHLPRDREAPAVLVLPGDWATCLFGRPHVPNPNRDRSPGAAELGCQGMINMGIL